MTYPDLPAPMRIESTSLKRQRLRSGLMEYHELTHQLITNDVTLEGNRSPPFFSQLQRSRKEKVAQVRFRLTYFFFCGGGGIAVQHTSGMMVM